MDILPAIDLLAGKCVRLVQGRYDRVIDYERDPGDMAREFAAAGARWAHVVDLEGARDGRIANIDAIRGIRDAGLRVQFGGGVRDEASAAAALAAGAERVIVGTRALEDWDWFTALARQPSLAGRICLGLDARQGKLAVHGWQRETHRTAAEVAEAVADLPLAAIVYTDIGRDGTLLGPNVDAVRSLVSVAHTPVIASGGVTELDDVRALSRIRLSGIVIGRAFYEGAIRVSDALAIAQQTGR
ncbi:MAG: 1-(5-phosphoribosyl)-5-[(5-phosphoribosylamino)methylideneamino]imidazole-4-carboxamide isomerase [Phycisphaerae bacterium]